MDTSSLYFGTAGWSYADWQGVFYPSSGGPKQKGLAYLSRYVDIAEINMSFYRVPTVEQADGWLEQVEGNPRFLLTMKLWQGFTHNGADLGSPEARAFAKVAARLASGGRLAGILAQFPWSFKYGPIHLDRIQAIADLYGAYGLIVETRHASWLRDEFFDVLRDRQLAFCNIDQPVIGESIAPSAIVTAPTGYVRFHGRRYDTWFADNAAPAERYDYLYKSDELSEWADRIREIASKADKTLVIANNHFNAKAVATALELENMLTDKRPGAPRELIEAYPHLREICMEDSPLPPPGLQLELF